MLDSEYRTACRRLLHDVAVADPEVFRRRARSATAAAAIAWIILKANHGFSQAEGGLTAKALGEFLGVGSNPGTRGDTMLKALGIPRTGYYDLTLGTPRYLVADRRRWMVDMRDSCTPNA